MPSKNTDRDWERLAKQAPYFAVLVDEKYRKPNLSAEERAEFFQSGFDHIADVLGKIRKHLDPDYRIRAALDFGCGVGRLVIPLAGIAETVTGADVSQAMLDEARRNCEARSLGNVKLVRSDDRLTPLAGKYDFIHSYIVFQHIPPGRGRRIFEALLGLLAGGGVCVAHFTYARGRGVRRIVPLIKTCVPAANSLINLARGRRVSEPYMQMNSYSLNTILSIMQRAGIRDFYAEYTDHGGHLGLTLYFRKPQ